MVGRFKYPVGFVALTLLAVACARNEQVLLDPQRLANGAEVQTLVTTAAENEEGGGSGMAGSIRTMTTFDVTEYVDASGQPLPPEVRVVSEHRVTARGAGAVVLDNLTGKALPAGILGGAQVLAAHETGRHIVKAAAARRPDRTKVVTRTTTGDVGVATGEVTSTANGGQTGDVALTGADVVTGNVDVVTGEVTNTVNGGDTDVQTGEVEVFTGDTDVRVENAPTVIAEAEGGRGGTLNGGNNVATASPFVIAEAGDATASPFILNENDPTIFVEPEIETDLFVDVGQIEVDVDPQVCVNALICE